MLKGSCLCGEVKYEIDGTIGNMGHCHCSKCRKAHGAAFGTYAPVAFDKFKFISGQDAVQKYKSSEGVTRTFCKHCGSCLHFIPEGKTGFGLAVGTLDSDSGKKPTYQIWTLSKAPWWDLDESLLSYEGERDRK